MAKPKRTTAGASSTFERDVGAMTTRRTPWSMILRRLIGRTMPFRQVGSVVVAVVLVAALFTVARDHADVAGRELALGNGSVWVPWGADGEIALVDGETGRLGARVGGFGEGDLVVAQTGTGAVVLNRESGRSFSVDGALQQARPGPRVGRKATGVEVAGEMAYLNVRGGLLPVRPESLEQAGDLLTAVSGGKVDQVPALAPGPDGRLWALDAATGRLATIEVGLVTDMVTVPGVGGDAELLVAGGTPVVLEADARNMWRADRGGASLVPGSVCIRSLAKIGPAAGARDLPWLAVTDPASGSVVTIDVATGTCSAPIDVALAGSEFGEPVVAGGLVYVPVISTGEVVVIDAARSAVIGRGTASRRPNGSLTLVGENNHVVFYSGGSRDVGAIGPDGSIRQEPPRQEPERPDSRAAGSAGVPTASVPRPEPESGSGPLAGSASGRGSGSPNGTGPSIGPGSDSGSPGTLSGSTPGSSSGVDPTPAGPGVTPGVDPTAGSGPPADSKAEPNPPTAPSVDECAAPEASLSAATDVVDVNEAVAFTVALIAAPNTCEIRQFEWDISGPKSDTRTGGASIELAFDTEGLYDIGATIRYRRGDGSTGTSSPVPDHLAVVVSSGTNPFIGVWEERAIRPSADLTLNWVVISTTSPGRVLIEGEGPFACRNNIEVACPGDRLTGTLTDANQIVVDPADSVQQGTLRLTPGGKGLLTDWIVGQEGRRDCLGRGYTRRGSPRQAEYLPVDLDCDGHDDVDSDNCPGAGNDDELNANPDQADADHDGIGDVCDTSDFVGRWHSPVDSIGIVRAERFSEYDSVTPDGDYLWVRESCATSAFFGCPGPLGHGMISAPPGDLPEWNSEATKPDQIKFAWADFRDMNHEASYFQPQTADARISTDGQTLTIYFRTMDANPDWRQAGDPPGLIRGPARCYLAVYTHEVGGGSVTPDAGCSGPRFDAPAGKQTGRRATAGAEG